MKYRCPTARIIGTSVIKDYELLFKGSKTGSYLTIEKKKGEQVPVVIWETKESDEDNGAVSNVDLLRRISQLEKFVYGKYNK